MELEQIEGTVEDIIYENQDNGYTVFEISGGGTVTVVCGIVGELHAGESVVCRGKYENHATYGRQFHAQECETDMPKDLEAVYAFLASGSLPYIGARTANKIIDKFGAAALEVIANDPAQLTLIPGISADKADRIQQEFKRMFGMRELIAYLAQFEISPRRAMEVFRVFGPGAMQAISQNPYLLCGEPLQLDFRHADSIAQYYHMEGDCTQRLEAALLRTLRHNAGNGHTCLPRAQLLDTASHFIQQPPEKLARALDHCIETGQLGVKMLEAVPYIYLPDLLEAEQAIADRLALLAKREKQKVRDLDKNIRVLELTQGFAYAPLQREAIRKAMTENCLVLTGGPGTGKTTTVNAILQLLEHQADRVALCAPTGRAAKRLSELTGRKASTIHRLLEVDYSGGVVSFIHNDKNLLKCDVVILDEMSMVDVKLFQALIAALRYSCRIIMVGDADQLPSVGPGNILGEVIRSGLVPTVCLNEIFRQARRSLIVENAHHIISSEPLQKANVKTLPYPGFPTDMQPQIAAVLSLAQGTSLVTEGVYGANRFKYVDELKRLGAHIQVDGKVAVIEGVDQLVGAPIQACDLRAGAALVIAGLAAKGTTELSCVQYIERGYEDLVGKLRAVGADIAMVDVPEESEAESHIS